MAIEGDHYVAADVAKNVLIILNESITNVIRHASASRAALDIQRDASSIRIELSDNGIGFDIDHHTRRSGISNIAKRASEHGFHAHVTSAPKQGTSVVVSFRVHSS
jgi:signal transduction histidine kinase